MLSHPLMDQRVQAIQRLEREQQASGLPLSRFIDSIRPGKGKRKGRDDEGDEAGEDGPLSGQQLSAHEALLQVTPKPVLMQLLQLPEAGQARMRSLCDFEPAWPGPAVHDLTGVCCTCLLES